VNYLSLAVINFEGCPFVSLSLGQAEPSSTQDLDEICARRTPESNAQTPNRRREPSMKIRSGEFSTGIDRTVAVSWL
jgi:hypothetical protein